MFSVFTSKKKIEISASIQSTVFAPRVLDFRYVQYKEKLQDKSSNIVFIFVLVVVIGSEKDKKIFIWTKNLIKKDKILFLCK